MLHWHNRFSSLTFVSFTWWFSFRNITMVSWRQFTWKKIGIMRGRRLICSISILDQFPYSTFTIRWIGKVRWVIKINSIIIMMFHNHDDDDNEVRKCNFRFEMISISLLIHSTRDFRRLWMESMKWNGWKSIDSLLCSLSSFDVDDWQCRKNFIHQ